jgi:hypothetical protein
MSIINVTPTQLREAADLKEQIASLQTQLAAVLGDNAPSPVAPKPAKRKMSASAIAQIRAAQKLRWAKIKGDKPAAKSAAVKIPKKGGISAAGRANIAAAARARWAKVKAAKGNPVAAKSVVVVKPAAKTAVVSKPARKKISAEGIARIKAAQKARWAKINAEKAAKKK